MAKPRFNGQRNLNVCMDRTMRFGTVGMGPRAMHLKGMVNFVNAGTFEYNSY